MNVCQNNPIRQQLHHVSCSILQRLQRASKLLKKVKTKRSTSDSLPTSSSNKKIDQENKQSLTWQKLIRRAWHLYLPSPTVFPPNCFFSCTHYEFLHRFPHRARSCLHSDNMKTLYLIYPSPPLFSSASSILQGILNQGGLNNPSERVSS